LVFIPLVSRVGREKNEYNEMCSVPSGYLWGFFLALISSISELQALK